MGQKPFLLVFVFLVLFSKAALAATIHGNIYDLSLNKVTGAVIEANTTPAQVLIAKDGTYSFGIPKGTYLVVASEREGGQLIAVENKTITVSQDGSYVIDFILFPIIEENTPIDLDFSDVAGSENNGMMAVFFAALAVIVVVVAIIWKRKQGSVSNKEDKAKGEPKENAPHDSADDDYLAKTMAVIKKQGGRTTQKDIRKEIPLSEAKISLLITELEHKGRIEKIKKGRGNIIILK